MPFINTPDPTPRLPRRDDRRVPDGGVPPGGRNAGAGPTGRLAGRQAGVEAVLVGRRDSVRGSRRARDRRRSTGSDRSAASRGRRGGLVEQTPARPPPHDRRPRGIARGPDRGRQGCRNPEQEHDQRGAPQVPVPTSAPDSTEGRKKLNACQKPRRRGPSPRTGRRSRASDPGRTLACPLGRRRSVPVSIEVSLSLGRHSRQGTRVRRC